MRRFSLRRTGYWDEPPGMFDNLSNITRQTTETGCMGSFGMILRETRTCGVNRLFPVWIGHHRCIYHLSYHRRWLASPVDLSHHLFREREIRGAIFAPLFYRRPLFLIIESGGG
jgi:hypothetical protein